MFLAEEAEEKKALDIKVLDVSKMTPLADFIVICSGESTPQIRAISSHLKDKAADLGAKPRRREGGERSNWMILDFGNVVVHIMGVEERSRYNLDELWGKSGIIFHL